MNTELKAFYTGQAKDLRAGIARQKRRNRIFVITGLVAFVAAVASVAAYTVYGGWGWLCGAGVLLCGYGVARMFDVRGCCRVERLTARCTVYENELKYLSGDFSPFDDGRRFADPAHPFTFDMDVFGPQSLYHRINRTVTTGGSERLAAMLSVLPQDSVATAAGDEMGEKEDKNAKISGFTDIIDNIKSQQCAIGELAEKERMRTEFVSHGVRECVDTRSVMAALDAVKTMKMPGFARSIVALTVAWASVVGIFIMILLSIFTPVPSSVPMVWGVVNLFVALMVGSGPLRQIGASAGRLHKEMRAYAGLVEIIASSETSSDGGHDSMLGALVADLRHSIGAFDALRRILDGLDRRGNVLGLIFFDALLLSDMFLVRRFARWQKAYAGSIGRWIDEVSKVDALVSMATFRYNEPEAGAAEIVDSIEMVYEVKGIWHPFVGSKAVRNDFTIADRHYYIVTGANMAGKSTFLRSLGINYILAMNGMPVFAERLRVSLFSLFSSMRTSDDLAHGISYFNAELLRLRQLLEYCRTHRHTLIILDEILKGTNSLDKLNGSRMFLEAVSRMPVSGVIATHDLELSRMADDETGRFGNWCFEISLADEITYTYKITPGVARNQNATHLLRAIISDGGVGR